MNQSAEIDALLARLDRAHQMGCSGPSDPARRTLYSQAAATIRALSNSFESKGDASDA